MDTGMDNGSKPSAKIAQGPQPTTIADKLKLMKEQSDLNKQKIKDATLEPIRTNITNLQIKEFDIDQVTNSLELKSDPNPDTKKGLGMKEYSEKVDKNLKNESATIDALLKGGKEMFEENDMDIKSKDELVNHPEFANNREAINYKKAETKAVELKKDDIKLQERLKKLGIEIAPDKFSYDTAIKLLKEKKEIIAEDILIEKSKTPEGKEEVIDVLSKRIENDLVENVPFTKNEIHYKNFLPPTAEMESLEKKFGSEIVKSAIMRVYEKRVNDFIDNRDKQTIKSDENIKSILGECSPQKREEARQLIASFNNIANNLVTEFKNKSSELKNKGIVLNTETNYDYGAKYKDFFVLANSNDMADITNNTRESTYTYPPKINYELLAEVAKMRINHINELASDIKKLETQEDVDHFNKDKDKGIAKAHEDLNKGHFKLYELKENLQYPYETNALNKFKSYEEATNYFKQKDIARNKEKQDVLQPVETCIDMQLKGNELANEKQIHNIDDSVESALNQTKKNSENATVTLTGIMKLEATLSGQDIVVKKGTITVPSLENNFESINNTINDQTKDLGTLNHSIETKEKNKPKLFGIGKWQKDLDALNILKNSISEAIKKQKEEKDKISSILNNIYRLNNGNRILEGLIKAQNGIRRPGEIFQELKTKLEEIIKTRVPDSVIKLNEEYKALEKKFEEYLEK